jgi:hypothetical protein
MVGEGWKVREIIWSKRYGASASRFDCTWTYPDLVTRIANKSVSTEGKRRVAMQPASMA